MSLLKPPPPERPSALTTGLFALAALSGLVWTGRTLPGYLTPAFWGLCAAGLTAGLWRALAPRSLPRLLPAFERGVFLALLCVSAWSLVLLGADRVGPALTALADPLQSNPMEGREAVKAWLLAQGRPIYSDLRGFDYIVTLYGPVYYALTGAAMRLFGPSLAVARAVSLAAGLVALAALALLCARLTRRPLPAAAAALALCGAPLMEYATLARPDMTAWAFFLTSLALVVPSPDQDAPGSDQEAPGFWRLALSGTLMALALCTKQQTWPFFAATLPYFLLQGRLRRVALPYMVSVAVPFLAALVFLYVWTGGEFFLQTLEFPKRMAAIVGGNSLEVAKARLWEFAREYPALLGLFGLYALFAAWSRRAVLPLALAVLPLPLLVAALGWTGADKNHFLGLLLALTMGVAVLLARASAVPGWGLPLVVALLGLLVAPRITPPADYKADRNRVEARTDQARRIVWAASVSGGPLLSDAEGAYVFLGRPEFAALKLFDAFETDVMARVRLWDPRASDLAAGIRQRRFPAVFQATAHIDEHVSGLLGVYYVPWLRVGDDTVRRPRPGQAILTVDDFRPDPLLAEPAVLRLTAFEGLQFDGDAFFDHVKLKAGETEGRMTLRLESRTPLGPVTLGLAPRLQTAQDAFAVEGAGEGRQGANWTFTRQKPGPAGPFEDRLECALPGLGEVVEFTCTLRGSAELWFSPDRPLFLALEAPEPAPAPQSESRDDTPVQQ